MEITKHLRGRLKVLELVPETPDEAALLLEFTQPGDTRLVVCQKDKDYTWPHLEIRRER